MASSVSAPSPAPRSSRRWLVYAAVVIVAVVSGAVTARYWVPERWLAAHGWLMAPGGDFGSGPSMSARLPGDDNPVLSPPLPPPAELMAPPAPAVDPRVDGLSQSLLILQRKVADLSQRSPPDRSTINQIITDQRSLGVSVAALETRIAAIEKSLDQASGAAAANHSMLLAAEDLRQSLMSSAPYAGPVAVLKTLGGHDPQVVTELAKLRDHADSGIPSRIVLAQRLGALADALAAPAALPAATPWWRRLLDQIERLVVIRHVVVDDATTTPEGVARLAMADLEQGDLSGAVSHLSTISGAAGDEVAPWLAQAQARLVAENATDRLVAELGARVATPAAIGSAP